MGVYRRRDTGVIFVKFTIRGREYRKSLPEATSKAQGKVVETQMRQEIFEGRYGREVGDLLFSDFVADHYDKYRRDNFRNYRWTKYTAKRFGEAFRGLRLGEITPLVIEEWKQKRMRTDTRKGHPPHPATVQNELAVLSSIFELACDNDLLSKNPMRKVRRFKQSEIVCRRSRVLSDEEEKRLRVVLQARKLGVYRAFLIAINTGMRRSEILRLKWEDINLAKGTIYVSQTKNGIPRTLPMSDELLEMFVGMSGTGKIFRITAKSFEGIHSAWVVSLTKAKIPDFRFHDLRHTFNSRLPSDAILRAAWLGHSKVDTNLIYSHVPLEEMRRAVQPNSTSFERNGTYAVQSKRKGMGNAGKRAKS